MQRGEFDYAIRQALNSFDNWNNATGCFEKFTSYYYEAQVCITDAVKIGIMVACGKKIEFDEDGGLIDKPEIEEDRIPQKCASCQCRRCVRNTPNVPAPGFVEEYPGRCPGCDECDGQVSGCDVNGEEDSE